jgi:hypothetical protein
MYTTFNFKSKKALKDAVAAGRPVRVYQPNQMYAMPETESDFTGMVTLEGPHYPEPHRWYARATLVGGVITKVT